MSEFKFRDYDVRVWNGDVFINSHDVIDYSGGHSGKGLQINTYDESVHEKIMSLCNNIAVQLIELDDILNDIEKNNEKNGE